MRCDMKDVVKFRKEVIHITAESANGHIDLFDHARLLFRDARHGPFNVISRHDEGMEVALKQVFRQMPFGSVAREADELER